MTGLEHETLCLIWFLLLGVLLAGYAMLDGFDLGVGMLHPIARDDHERRIFMNSIGPLWDGNEVWLVTFGGAMFAAFPNVYASVFSAFYIPFMLLLFALILRAVSMEFRSKRPGRLWRRSWDTAFFLGSSLAALLFGVAVGNAMIGIPLDPAHNYTGNVIDMLTPYPLLVGLMTLSLFAMHGSIFLYLKTDGQLHARMHKWMWGTFFVFLLMYALTTVVTLLTLPNATANLRDLWWGWIIVILNVLAIANIPRAIHLKRPFYAFVSSCCTIAAFVFLFGVAIFPNLLVNAADASNSLTIYNDASSLKTLEIMLIIALLGMPCVLAYTTAIYWVFRGKTQLGEHSY
ncbi:MAG: cytochrome d ubiquinol oxidase subunit II [Phycisphaeraceae bacterium]|nr:cytochrome d ubiquinol oxidase subunit II [Phycisphaeraceae bacterium]